MNCTGAAGSPGAMTPPPSAMRFSHHVKRPVGSCGPTLRPGRAIGDTVLGGGEEARSAVAAVQRLPDDVAAEEARAADDEQLHGAAGARSSGAPRASACRQARHRQPS
jgi:hypothetical protein